MTTWSELLGALREVFVDDDAVWNWLETPSLYLNGETPQQVIDQGQVDDAAGALEALRSGIFI